MVSIKVIDAPIITVRVVVKSPPTQEKLIKELKRADLTLVSVIRTVIPKHPDMAVEIYCSVIETRHLV